MAFLDNSGDIILDAVLTDAGRKRMAEGGFNITYFALGDDEIDYSLYNNQDSRGSAYYDIDILSTPVLEAFTDNMSSVKSKLMTITRKDLLYLPVIKIDGTSGDHSTNSSGSFYVAVNEETWDLFSSTNKNGVLDAKKQGDNNGVRKSSNFILLHQGIDNEAKESIDADLVEVSFIVEIDERFGEIRSKPTTNGTTQKASTSYVDDDNIASYVLAGDPYVTNLEDSDVIAGPTGSSLEFTIFANDRLRETDYLMQRLGGITSISTSNDCYFVDINVRVTGVNTGYRVDIPVRFLKKIGS